MQGRVHKSPLRMLGLCALPCKAGSHLLIPLSALYDHTCSDAERAVTSHLALCSARTNFNALELMCSMPDDAQVILDAMREGKGQREAARQHMGGGGLISQVVASALEQLPNMVDSSTQEGEYTILLWAAVLHEGLQRQGAF